MITSLISNIITILVLVNLMVIFVIRKAYANGVFTIDVNKSLLTPIYYAAKMTLGVEAEKGSYAVSMSFMGYRLIIKAKQ